MLKDFIKICYFGTKQKTLNLKSKQKNFLEDSAIKRNFFNNIQKNEEFSKANRINSITPNTKQNNKVQQKIPKQN